MPVEQIVEKIKKDIEAKVDSIMEEKREEAEEIRSEIEQEKEKKLDALRKEKEREIKTLKNRLLSQAELEKRKKKLNVREEMIEKVFDESKARLEKMDPGDYDDYLRKSIGRSARLLEGEIKVYCDPDAQEKVKELAEKIDPSIKLEGSLDSIGGIKAVSESGATIDLTFEANLKRKKKELRKQISEILFPEE